MIYKLFKRVEKPNRFKLIDANATFDNGFYDPCDADGAVKAVVQTYLDAAGENEGEFLVQYDAYTGDEAKVFSALIVVEPPLPAAPILRVI